MLSLPCETINICSCKECSFEVYCELGVEQEVLKHKNNMLRLHDIAKANGYYWDTADMDYEYFSNGHKEVAVAREDIELGNIENIVW